jgi:hypothetical protein
MFAIVARQLASVAAGKREEIHSGLFSQISTQSVVAWMSEGDALYRKALYRGRALVYHRSHALEDLLWTYSILVHRSNSQGLSGNSTGWSNSVVE